MKSKFLFCVLALLYTNSSYAQQFHAKLTDVDSSDFYMINLPLEVMKEAENPTDFQLINDDGDFVPYILRVIDHIQLNRSLHNYKYDVSEIGDSTQIVVTTNKQVIDYFYLLVKNSKGVKRASIVGSNDSLKWFNVREEIMINPESRIGTHSFVKVKFPQSDYHLYKVIVSNSTSASLNIVGAKYGVVDTVELDNQFEILVDNVHYRDTAKIVHLSMALPNNIHINDINVYVSSPRFFNREAHVYKSKKPIELAATRQNRRNRTRISSPQHTRYNLSSGEGKVSSIYIGGKCDSLYIDILNGSNTPLSIDSITYTTNHHKLIAYLEEGEDYSLAYGGIPQQSDYDMSFVDHIPDAMEPLEIVSIKTSKQIEIDKENSVWRVFFKKYSILIIIIVAIIAILSISYRLIRDKKEE